MNVNPAANVEDVQTKITMLLSLPFSYDVFSLTADAKSISIVPVGGCSVCSTPLLAVFSLARHRTTGSIKD